MLNFQSRASLTLSGGYYAIVRYVHVIVKGNDGISYISRQATQCFARYDSPGICLIAAHFAAINEKY
jgi:hypothetical protein